MAGTRRRWLAVAVVAALVVAVAGLAWVWSRPGAPRTHHFAGTADYLPGVAADLYLPSDSARPAATATPLVVMVPGGGWQSADRRGLGPLADTLAGRGMVVVNATYRAADSRARFPQPVTDISCSVDYAVARARQAGYPPGPVVLLGHSSGAQLASLAALGPTHFRGRCAYPTVQADGFIGLSGPYDIAKVSDLAYPLFDASPTEAAAAWREGNPFTWVHARTGDHPLRVLLAAGDSDSLVSPTFSTTFAAALRQAGHPVQLTIVPGATHASIYQPKVIATTIESWIAAWPASAGQTPSTRASGSPAR